MKSCKAERKGWEGGLHTRRFLGTIISSNEKSLVSTPRRSDEEDDEVEEKV